MTGDESTWVWLVCALALVAGTLLTLIGIVRAGRFEPAMLLGILPMSIGALILIVFGFALLEFFAGLFG